MNENFEDLYIQLGGDDVNPKCFDENPSIKDFMKKNNIADYKALINFHISKVRYILS